MSLECEFKDIFGFRDMTLIIEQLRIFLKSACKSSVVLIVTHELFDIRRAIFELKVGICDTCEIYDLFI